MGTTTLHEHIKAHRNKKAGGAIPLSFVL